MTKEEQEVLEKFAKSGITAQELAENISKGLYKFGISIKEIEEERNNKSENK